MQQQEYHLRWNAERGQVESGGTTDWIARPEIAAATAASRSTTIDIPLSTCLRPVRTGPTSLIRPTDATRYVGERRHLKFMHIYLQLNAMTGGDDMLKESPFYITDSDITAIQRLTEAKGIKVLAPLGELLNTSYDSANYFIETLDFYLSILINLHEVDSTIRFSIISSDQYIARSGKIGNSYYLIFSDVFVSKIQDLSRLICNNNIFSNAFFRENFQEYNTDVFTGKTSFSIINRPRQGLDLLTQIQVTYFLVAGSIICHEIGHIFNGHIDFLNHLSRNSDIIPLSNEDTRKCMEYDADSFAMSSIIKICLNCNITTLKNAQAFRFLDVYKVATFATMASIALHLKEEDRFHTDHREHPSTLFRMMAFSGIASEYARVLHGVSYDISANQIADIFLNVAQLLGVESVAKFHKLGQDYTWVGDEYHAYFVQILANWHYLYPYLSEMKLRTGSLAEPQDLST